MFKSFFILPKLMKGPSGFQSVMTGVDLNSAAFMIPNHPMLVKPEHQWQGHGEENGLCAVFD